MSNENPDPYMQMLAEHEDICLRLAALKEQELDLRLKLFSGAFPNPKEGTNTWKLPDGREAELVTIDRAVDAETPVADKRTANVLERTAEGWRIEAYRYTIKENQSVNRPALLARPGLPEVIR